MIRYIKGNVLDIPADSTIIHACNGKGVWGAGVARQIGKRFPYAYKAYETYCKTNKPKGGELLMIDTPYCRIGCLITSKNYGIFKDKPDVIIKNTSEAIGKLSKLGIKKVYMPRINSGIFGVDWKRTEAILKRYDDIEFIVVDYQERTNR